MHKHATHSSLSKFRTLAFAGTALIASVTAASAQNVIFDGNALFTPSFRAGSNTTYFGWTSGNWDGNVDTAPPNVDIINSTPNVGSGFGPLLTQGVAADIISGSNNIYSDVPALAGLGLSLSIPTSGTPGSGFTTIIIQGKGLSGASFLLDTGIDTFGFGTINGIAPTYVYGNNSSLQTQFWAKWELPGNSASYNVSIAGFDVDTREGDDYVYPVSVTDMIIDTQWSPTSYAPDSAIAAPEPGSALMILSGTALLGMLRRRRSA